MVVKKNFWYMNYQTISYCFGFKRFFHSVKVSIWMFFFRLTICCERDQNPVPLGLVSIRQSGPFASYENSFISQKSHDDNIQSVKCEKNESNTKLTNTRIRGASRLCLSLPWWMRKYSRPQVWKRIQSHQDCGSSKDQGRLSWTFLSKNRAFSPEVGEKEKEIQRDEIIKKKSVCRMKMRRKNSLLEINKLKIKKIIIFPK